VGIGGVLLYSIVKAQSERTPPKGDSRWQEVGIVWKSEIGRVGNQSHSCFCYELFRKKQDLV
jgi:hypothetical protein